VKILVLGASGMLGHTVLRYLAQSPGHSVVGSVRSERARQLLPEGLHGQIVCAPSVDTDSLVQLLDRVRPQVVVNCVGVVKQLAEADDPLAAIPVNSLLPHRLLRVCKLAGARVVHFSTDCVFSGAKGMYREVDSADATDLYGRSKLLGELNDTVALTLRLSVIGPELDGAHGLLGWFLSQRGHTRGFRRAIFSGVTTVELARVLRDFVLPRPELRGVLHLAADPISKYELLTLIARIYGVAIDIEPDDKLVIDRSLDSRLFRQLTGYVAPSWPELISVMRQFG
jgi:dTDP-4-dehydrorhamnose reductase